MPSTDQIYQEFLALKNSILRIKELTPLDNPNGTETLPAWSATLQKEVQIPINKLINAANANIVENGSRLIFKGENNTDLDNVEVGDSVIALDSNFNIFIGQYIDENEDDEDYLNPDAYTNALSLQKITEKGATTDKVIETAGYKKTGNTDAEIPTLGGGDIKTADAKEYPRDWQSGEIFTADVASTITRYHNKKRYSLIKSNVVFPFTTTDIDTEFNEVPPKWVLNSAKKLSEFDDDIGATDPITALTAYLDIVDGNDGTASLENSNKPFQSMSALVNALPATTGETWNIVITGGTIPVTRRLPGRNLRFSSLRPAILDFTNCLEDDGITQAIYVINTPADNQSIYTFTGRNIDIISNASSDMAFGSGETFMIGFQGYIRNFLWLSKFNIGAVNFNMLLSPLTDLTFGYVESLLDVGVYYSFYLYGDSFISLKVEKYKSTTFRNTLVFSSNTAVVPGTVYIDEVIGTGSYLTLALGSNFDFSIKKIDTATVVRPGANRVNFDNTQVVQPCTINVFRTKIFTGKLNGNAKIDGNELNNPITFLNFEGVIDSIRTLTSTPTIYEKIFDNCNIICNSILYDCQKDVNDTVGIRFKRFNTITQLNTSSYLFKAIAGRTIDVNIEGSVSLINAKILGKVVRRNKIGATLSEKFKEKLIKGKDELTNRILPSDVIYVPDGELTFVAGDYILNNTGLSFDGYGLKVSKLKKDVAGEPLVVSPNYSGYSGLPGYNASGFSGDFFASNLTIETPQSTALYLDNGGNSGAIEINDVNFENCQKNGYLKAYRQFTGTTNGIYSIDNGWELDGTWNGFKLTNTNGFNIDAAAILFKAGATLLFNDRFYLEANLSLPTGAVLADFSASNFADDEAFQIVNSRITYNGTVAAQGSTSAVDAAILPNISPNNAKAAFSNNKGITNTALPFVDIKDTTDGNIYRVTIVNGTLTLTAL